MLLSVFQKLVNQTVKKQSFNGNSYFKKGLTELKMNYPAASSGELNPQRLKKLPLFFRKVFAVTSAGFELNVMCFIIATGIRYLL
jgi:hypothetical protein